MLSTALAPAAGAAALQPSGGYVVVLDDGLDARTFAQDLGLTPTGVYSHALDGFSVTVRATVAQTIAATPGVAHIEADRAFTVTGEVPTGVDRIQADQLPAAGIGTGQAIDADVAVSTPATTAPTAT